MPFFTTSDRAKLYYEDFGKGERTIVFLHGLMDSHVSFQEAAQNLSRKYRIVVYDQRGHGQSDAPRDGCTIPRLAQDAHELIEYLSLERVVLMGYSLGVHVLFDYVEQFGEEHISNYVLSVMSPKLITDESYKLGLNGKFTREDADRAIRNTRRYFYLMRLLGVKAYTGDKKYLKQVSPYYERMKKLKRRPMVALYAALGEGDYWSTLDKMTKPSLDLSGEHDIYPKETHEAICARLKDAKLAVVPDAGHMALLERPEIYMAELEAFLDGTHEG